MLILLYITLEAGSSIFDGEGTQTTSEGLNCNMFRVFIDLTLHRHEVK